jgi:hypothetical protein
MVPLDETVLGHRRLIMPQVKGHGVRAEEVA